MEAHLAPTQPTHANKITSLCEICIGYNDTQYCMENHEQAFIEYASSCTDEAGGKWYTFNPEQNNFGDTYNPSWKSYPNLSQFQTTTITIHPKQQSNYHDNKLEWNKEEEKDRPENVDTNPSTPIDPSVPFITEKFLKLNSFFESLGLVPQSSNTEFVYTKGDDGDVMFIEIIKKDDDSRKEEPKAGRLVVEYFDTFPTQSELAHHKYLMRGPIPSIFLRNPIITEGCPSNLKIPCNIIHVHVEKAYIDLNSPLNIMTRMMYN
ncbi:hypothetical protein Tco_1207695 [Tanacetum coccineum]